MIICEIHISIFFNVDNLFYNEIKLCMAVNTELSFLSGPYLIKNQIRHKRNFQNIDRC
jgi:hypothetical protein